MTSSVVCGVDHSPHARQAAGFAAGLADRLQLRLVLVHAIPGTETRAAGKRLVGEIAEDIGAADVTGRVEHGPAAECVCHVANEESARFVVVGTHGEGAAHAMLVGSTSLAVVRSAACPVVVVPPLVTKEALALPDAESIVCGISHPDDAAPVCVATRLARELDLTLLPVHVVPIHDVEPSGRTVADIRTLLTDRVAEARLARTQTALAATIDAAGSSRAALAGPIIRVGEPAQQLAQFAEEARAAMLVVGTRGRGAVRSGLFGSVSRDLARSSTTPVVVCPEGATL